MNHVTHVAYKRVKARVPGLPIRDCAGSCNSRGQRRPKVSAIVVTAKAIFERLYLVLKLSTIEPRVNCPYAPTPPLATGRIFLDFCAICFPSGPSFFCQHDSPSNLAESRYPRHGTQMFNEYWLVTKTWWWVTSLMCLTKESWHTYVLRIMNHITHVDESTKTSLVDCSFVTKSKRR